jgi:ABC-type amino acid transport substrate-binding protein
MAAKKSAPARVADLKSRFARIKQAIMAVDALTTDYLDRVGNDLEGFAVDLAETTGRTEDQAPN